VLAAYLNRIVIVFGRIGLFVKEKSAAITTAVDNLETLIGDIEE